MFKKLLFILAVIVTLNTGMIIGICGDEEYPDPWSVEPTEQAAEQGN